MLKLTVTRMVRNLSRSKIYNYDLGSTICSNCEILPATRKSFDLRNHDPYSFRIFENYQRL